MTSSQLASRQSDAPRGARSRYFNPFRLSSYLLALYTLGHTFGAVIGTPDLGTESNGVVALMKSVHVRSQSADCTWYGFYRGFGALVSVYFVLSIALTWHLGGANDADRAVLRPVARALFLSHVAGAAVALVYFFPAPIFFATSISILLGLGCLRDWRQVSPGPATPLSQVTPPAETTVGRGP